MGDTDRALSAYENALRHNPHSMEGLTQVAGIARIRENYSKVSLMTCRSITPSFSYSSHGHFFFHLILILFENEPNQFISLHVVSISIERRFFFCRSSNPGGPSLLPSWLLHAMRLLLLPLPFYLYFFGVPVLLLLGMSLFPDGLFGVGGTAFKLFLT